MDLPRILIALAAIIAVDRLAWGVVPGAGSAVAVLVCAACCALARWRRLNDRMAALTGAFTVSACAAGVVDQGLLPAMLQLAGLGAFAAALRRSEGDAWAAVAGAWSAGWFGWIRAIADGAMVARLRQRTRRTMRAIAWMLPMAIGAVFIGCFAIANPVLAGWIGEAWDAIALPDWLRCTWWLLLIALVWGLLRGAPRGARMRQRRSDEPEGPASDHRGLVVRSLVVLHGVFLLQNGLDLWYLWGHAELPPGMTWAGYAHRGAYPLVATALLAAGFILAWFRPGSPVQADPLCRALVIAWIVQNAILLASAGWRLGLYIEAYDLSRWRVAAAVWMWLVAGGLVLIAVRIARDHANRWLVNANTTLVAATLLAVAWYDVDGLIVRYNLRHGPAKTDVAYLASLGPSAWPTLRSLNQLDDDAAVNGWTTLEREVGDWRSWTVRKAAWHDALSATCRASAPR